MTHPSALLRGLLPPRPVLSHTALNLIVATYIMALLNFGFWTRLFSALPEAPLTAAIFGLAVWALTLLLLELLGPSRLQRPVAAVLIVIAASAQYYERAFGVLIDRELVRAIIETTAAESRHLMTPEMAGTLLLTGGLPAALVFWPRVRRVAGWHTLWRWPLGVTLSVALMVGALFSQYKDYAAMLRERRDLMSSYQPGASIAAVVKFAREEFKTADPVVAPVGTDARPGRFLAITEKPVLLVVFLGETVRAQNFGLNGYARDTTPELRKRDVLNFSQVTACGTSTAVSVPCMFSPLAREDYSREGFMGNETLLDVLDHAGIDAQWWDNNTGDQNIAKRTGWQNITAFLPENFCDGECQDTAFLPLIDRTLAEMTTNTVLVLHMIGSHGPSYYLRYPTDRAVFQPDCRTAQFSDCTTQEIINAYDNSILETDRVLAATIDRLAAADRVSAAMLYVSDHGESLGEGGLFLHAAPAFMAPEQQTQVPMVLWLSRRFADAMALDRDCLAAKSDEPINHDNIFHSVLGLIDIETTARATGLDLTADCRTVRS